MTRNAMESGKPYGERTFIALSKRSQNLIEKLHEWPKKGLQTQRCRGSKYIVNEMYKKCMEYGRYDKRRGDLIKHSGFRRVTSLAP